MTHDDDTTQTRRGFLKSTLFAAAGLGVGAVAYPFIEAKWCALRSVDVRVPRLGTQFAGTTVALVTDVHHGPFVPLSYVEEVIALTNEARPDLVCLCGDYVHREPRYIAPCLRALGRLGAPLGVFGVLGNHDHWEGAAATRAGMAAAGIYDLTNRGMWLEKNGERLRVCGVGDLWEDGQDLDAALGDATLDDALLLLSHNPDYVEEIADPRVGLVLSGHTHGGQVSLPLVGAPIVPSRYGQKYVHGLVQTEVTQVYISRGVGTITPPVRFNCRPEVVLLTLRQGATA